MSGSATLSQDVAEFFHAAGILILEGYGLTETSAGTFVNRPDHYKLGTVGLVFPGTDVRLAEDGEVLLRGPGVMTGYHGLPEQTAEALTDDGWLRTGDIGELDADGFLSITDRKKDLIKTSQGKYVAPQAIEVLFKGACALASQIVVLGDGRSYCTALITLDEDALTQWAKHRAVTATYDELTRHDERAGGGGRGDRLRQRPAEPLGDHQDVPHPRPRPEHRGGRADAEPEGAPEGGRGSTTPR